MHQPVNEPGKRQDATGASVSPIAADWFWHPWYAKLLWTVAAVYWAGLYGMLLIPDDQHNYYVAGAMILLVFVLNPISVIAILGRGFVKAKVTCGDSIILPGLPPDIEEWNEREREAAYLNPVDIRSGYLHQQYLEGLTPHPNGHGGL
jgi:hypothetical protein